MKTKLTALTLSACLLGWSSASPAEKTGDQPASIAPAVEQVKNVHRDADADKTAKAARKDRAAELAKKAEERKAAKKKAAEMKASAAKSKDDASRQAADAKKMEDSKKALAAAAAKKADDAKKAQAAAANKKAEEEKMHKMALARLQELSIQKKNAEANRSKAADALKLSERKMDAISSEINRVNGELKTKADADQRKSEQAKAQRIRESDAQEQAMISTMKNDIRELKQAVEHLTKQVSEMKCDCRPAPTPVTR